MKQVDMPDWEWRLRMRRELAIQAMLEHRIAPEYRDEYEGGKRALTESIVANQRRERATGWVPDFESSKEKLDAWNAGFEAWLTSLDERLEAAEGGK